MIRLRRQIDRALANRWLRILLLVLLIGLFLLFVLHTRHDAVADGEAFVCLALVVLLFIVVPPHVVVRAVATGRLERKLGLLKPFLLPSHLRPVATGCARSAPQMLHPMSSVKATRRATAAWLLRQSVVHSGRVARSTAAVASGARAAILD